MIEFNPQQQTQLDNLGISKETVQKQIDNFVNGFPFLSITRSAKVGDGIKKLTSDELERFVKLYEQEVSKTEVVKFVPASGAASRMFKNLFAFVDKGSNDLSGNTFIEKFINDIKDFAFYKLLSDSFLKKGESLEDKLQSGEYVAVVNELISEDGLNYGGLPKGLLEFHAYGNDSRTPVEEHFAEGGLYAVGKDRVVNLHFTVTPDHEALFKAKVAEVQKSFEEKYNVRYNVSYSQQLKSTDTIAVTMDNEPFIELDGNILYRPAGHGALLSNLDALSSNVVFVKNIDNVVPDHLKGETVKYKKALGGLLLSIKKDVHETLSHLKGDATLSHISSVKRFVEEDLNIGLPANFDDLSAQQQVDCLIGKLDRPIRVCGMVKNTGEPGGGPFYVLADDGSISLQIAETAQLDLDNKEVADKLNTSTHFNPVDLVCAITDFEGKPFDLMKYRDDSTGFVSSKSKNGRELKAQELPGLWNGAMADWITLFVEVPLITFNPVKTVNDLLRDQHQGE